MIRGVIVRQPALEDITDPAAWYETQRAGLGEELVDEIVRALERAKANPNLFRVVRHDGEIRRVLTERFPYRIFFSVVAETLYVHAILHGAQHDRRWKERL
jgi:plasmid stabilization system protein ParE